MKNRFERENLVSPEEQEREEKPAESAPEVISEREATERQLSPEEVGEYKSEMDDYVQGLRARVSELEAEREALRQMSAEAEKFAKMREIENELAELNEQIDGLQDSSEAIAEQGEDAVIRIKE